MVGKKAWLAVHIEPSACGRTTSGQSRGVAAGCFAAISVPAPARGALRMAVGGGVAARGRDPALDAAAASAGRFLKAGCTAQVSAWHRSAFDDASDRLVLSLSIPLFFAHDRRPRYCPRSTGADQLAWRAGRDAHA